MTWQEQIIAVHTAVTDQVGHNAQMQSDRYFVWQQDGRNDFMASNRHNEKTVTGTTDLYTKMEDDPWAEQFETSLEAAGNIAWYLNSTQYEEDTGFHHYEWVWQIPMGVPNG